jgi:hypothetical protein
MPKLFGLAWEEYFQGEIGQRISAAKFLPGRDHQVRLCCRRGQGGSAANFLPANERQYKKEAVCAHGVGGQSNHPWDLDDDLKQVMHWEAMLTPLTVPH